MAVRGPRSRVHGRFLEVAVAAGCLREGGGGGWAADATRYRDSNVCAWFPYAMVVELVSPALEALVTTEALAPTLWHHIKFSAGTCKQDTYGARSSRCDTFTLPCTCKHASMHAHTRAHSRTHSYCRAQGSLHSCHVTNLHQDMVALNITSHNFANAVQSAGLGGWCTADSWRSPWLLVASGG